MAGRTYFSQAGQDLFVLDMVGGRRNGFYCEIGGADPFDSSNTFLLKKDFGWKGVSIELDPKLAGKFQKERSNPCVCADATGIDYVELFKNQRFPAEMDYLSV